MIQGSIGGGPEQHGMVQSLSNLNTAAATKLSVPNIKNIASEVVDENPQYEDDGANEMYVEIVQSN
jgi:hypothetical protein